MALLKVGSKAPVFVTHVEFVDTECQIFCQVGNVGGQADTLAERIAECVENGLASQISSCAVGDLCLALFHEDNSWYRGRVLQNLGHSLKVYFIDYGNTETVRMNDIREAPEYVLAIPALSTKCIVCDCKPLSGVWTDEEKKKIETMLHSGEFTCEIIGTDNSDVNNEVHTVKLYNNDAPNTPIFVRPASSSSQSLKPLSLSVGQEYEVYISYVESSSKFWVQLKSQENDLNSLMADIGACFAEDLPSTGDIVNPSEGQVCAACFSDDGAFYRGIAKYVKGGSCTVFFVDYGNKEEKRTSELFTLPQALCQLPMQAVPCAYHVESPAIEDKLHKLAEEDGPSIIKVLSGNSNSGYVVEVTSIEQMLKSSKVPMQPQIGQTKSATKLWESYTSVVMQADGIYDVCISHVDHPGQFFVQLLGNANNLDKLMQAIDEVAHNYDKLSNVYKGYPCLAKFSDESWYRGEVVIAEAGKITVAAVDFGFIEVLPPSQLRNTDPNFKMLPAQAVRCTIDMNKVDHSQWKLADIEKFKGLVEKNVLVAKVLAKKGFVHQVDLYETEKGVERHLNAELMNMPQTTATNEPMQSNPRLQSVSVAPKATLLPPEVSVGSRYVLCFTAIKAQYIYGQLTNTPVDKIAKLQTDLNTYFDKKQGESLLSTEIGSVCCTQYVDGGWYRGMVTALSGGKAEVAFVDFGDSVMKLISDLKALPSSLCGLPQQCILCKIDNIPSSAKLEKLVNKRAEVMLTGKEVGVYPAFVAQITENRVLEQFQDQAASQPTGFKGASSRTFNRPQRDEASTPKNMSGRKPSGDSYAQQEVAVNSTQEVMVTYVKDPSNFQVVLDKMNSSLDVVMDQLHEYYDALPPGGDKLENPRLGQPCVAKFTEDNGWYRAVVTGLKVDGQAEVMYVDYGNNEYTDRDALKVIKQQFMSLPAQAVQCRLSGVSSSQGFWSPEHIVQFTEMVEEQSFESTFKGEIREHGQLVYKVELVDKKGTNINHKFGSMTGTTCPETETGPSSRSVTASKLGQGMKITVAGGDRDSGWDEDGDSGASSGFGSKPRSFSGGRQPNGTSSGFGSRSSGFGSKASGGDSGWDEDSSGEASSGFGNKKPFGSGGGGRDGGFSGGRGGGGRGGFGGSRGGGFGGSRGGGGGFGSSTEDGGSESGGFGKSGGFGSSSGGGFGAGGGGSKDCFKCGESGHFSRECPNAAKGGGRDCYKCGETGHMARDCTNPPKAGGGRECYKCGESGHMARDCTNPPKAGGGRDCFKCGESGHMARDCTNPPKAGSGGGGRECYKCGEGGHMARDCTNPPKEGAGPKRGFGSGSDRSSGGGFGGRGGGFGSRGGGGEDNSESWGDGDSKGRTTGFGSRGGSGGFGSRDSNSGSSGGGFGSRPGNSGGGFGSRSAAGGFGKKEKENDWGSSESTIKAVGAGGFGSQSGGFGKKDVGGGGDDWDTEATPLPAPVASPAGDGPGMGKVGKDAVFSVVTLDIKQTVDVYVVYVTSPENFWCQLMKNSSDLEKLMEEMNAFYNGLPEGDLVLEKPVVGIPCAAKFSEDNMWYRAEVLSPSQHQVEVLFVDYGNTETVAADKIRKLKPEYLTLKAQGIKCSLDDVISTDKIWTRKSVEDFEDLTQDKHLVAKVIDRTSEMIHVLDIENLDEKINVADAMCEKGHCTFKSTKRSPVKERIVQNPYQVADLKENQEIDVYVSWIENPEQFWIQPVSQENDLLKLVEKVQELYTTSTGANLKIDSLVPGQAVVAKFTEDEAWYRGYVEKIVGGKCKVRFTDYGNSDMVDQESLRLPTDNILKEASKAAVCKLVGVRPLQAGQWTADARDIMDGLVKDEVVKCKIVEISNGLFSVELKSKGVDIREELIQAAVVRGEKEASPGASASQSQLSTSSLTYSSQMQLTIGMTEAVFVSHTDSVASFWCQPVRTAADLEEVMAQLETHCKSGTGVQNFPTDMACAAKFSEDENWYRAKVTAAYPDSVEVLFVDYGNTEKVSKSDICELTEELVQLPPQAVECELVNSSKASNQLTAMFTELIGEQEVQATVINVQDGSAVVSLRLPSGKVVEEELGLSEPGSTPGTNEEAKKTKSEPQGLSYPETVMPSAPKVAFITQIINPGEFYLQLAEKESQLNALMAEISEYCQSEEAENLPSLTKGQVCCAKFTDGEWYRAKILKVEGSNVSVEFVDYGNWEVSTNDNIRSILPKFVKAPPFVLKCSLEGIVPVNGTWSEEAVKKFEELAVEKDLMCETVTGSEVVLKCGDTDISEALVECGVAKRLEGSKRLVKDVPAKVLSYSKPTLPTEAVDVYISYVNSPEDFCVQLVSKEEQLNELMEKLAQLYESSDDNLKLNSVLLGQAVAAKYSEDEAWYRAEVTQVDGSSVTVCFVDYGNTEETSIANLRMLKDEMVTAPQYAIRCELNKAQPDQGKWSEEACDYFETLTTEKVLQCEFVAGNTVLLKTDGASVVERLVEKGYARKDVSVVSPSKPKGQFMPQNVPADCVSCYVSHVDEDGTLYVQLVCEEDTLNTVVEKVQQLQSTEQLDIEKVGKGNLVCARFSEDQSWYRAVVIETSNNTTTVRFVDYGNCDDIKQSSDLRALPESLQVTPPLAYTCRLQGLKSLSSSQVELLRETTADKELTVTFNTSSPVYEVQLEDENQQDFLQILGGAGGNQEQEMVEETVVAEKEVEEQTAQESTAVGQEVSEEVDSETQGAVPDVDLDQITEKISELQTVKLAVEQRVKVQVSHSDSPSKLWVQLESEKEKLDALLNSMYDFYSSCCDRRLTVDSVCKDMVFAALYSEDESWYRAKVVDCDIQDEVTVMFLDHGNTEVVSRDSLRKLPTEFCQLPTQAVECCLGAVQPSQDDWTEEAKETFTSLTADKVLLLDVGNINEQGVYKVQLLDMGMSIGDLLLQKDVGAQIATPVAVSTKVKHVFSPDTADEVITRLYSAKASQTSGKYGYRLRDLAETDPTISSHNVLVTAISSPVEFWCRLEDNSYDFYQDKLQESYTENKEQMTGINNGDKCVACVEDKEFHRGAVLNKSEDGVCVKLVDIGSNVTVPESNVFALKPEFDEYPQLAFCCSFTCVSPVEGKEFSEEACKVFRDTVLELSEVTELPGSGKATVVAEEEGIVLIELTIDRKDIAESLVEKGVVKFDESKDLSVVNTQDELNDFSEKFGAFGNVQLNVDNDFDVVLIDCSDMNRLVFHKVDCLSVMKEIEASISEAVSSKAGGEDIDELTEGPCLAKRPDNNLWYRANLRCIDQMAAGKDSQEKFKVFLVDYGSTYDLPKSSILPIPDSLRDKPGQAIICHLDEIEPFDEEWEEECYSLFTQQYMSKDSLLVVYVNSYNKGVHEVLLSARGQGEKSVNQLLVEMGMAAPVSGSQIEMSVLADTTETSFHELSMSRQDSYGDSTDFGETSYEPDSSCLADTSYITEGDTSYVTEGDTSRFTEGDTSRFTESDTSYTTKDETSYFTETDTSCLTDGGTSSYMTVDESFPTTDVDTSYVTDTGTSRFTEGDTTGLTEGNTSQYSESDTSYLTEGDTSKFTEKDTTETTESEGDTSVNTLDGTHWVCEDCSAENDLDEPMVECKNCHSVRKVTADSQYTSEAKSEGAAEKSKTKESSKDEDSDKEDFEDAPETDEGNKEKTEKTKDSVTSSPERESTGTGDNESFYDVEEADKTKEEKTE